MRLNQSTDDIDADAIERHFEQADAEIQSKLTRARNHRAVVRLPRQRTGGSR